LNFSVNNQALQIIEEQLIPNLYSYNCTMSVLSNGSTVFDMGVKAKGGFMAGKLFVETGLGGLGTVSFKTMNIKNQVVPVASVTLDRPAIAELSSFCAAFFVTYRGKNVSISGPIRSLKEDVYSRVMGYQDKNVRKVICHIQTDTLPDELLTDTIADQIGGSAKDIIILAAKTSGMTGSVQICSRNVEQTLPTLVDRGFNVHTILQATGYTPIASVTDDPLKAMGWVNDCLIYGQETNLYVDCEDEEITDIANELTFVKNNVYGTPFETIFSWCENDWAKVPRNWDAPCKVNFFNMRTNNKFFIGKLNMDLLHHAQGYEDKQAFF